MFLTARVLSCRKTSLKEQHIHIRVNAEHILRTRALMKLRECEKNTKRSVRKENANILFSFYAVKRLYLQGWYDIGVMAYNGDDHRLAHML